MSTPRTPEFAAPPAMRRLRKGWGIAVELGEVARHFRRRAAQLKIILIELRDALQPLDIAQRELPLLQRDERVGAELLQDAVDMDGGQAERVGELDLGQRQADGVGIAHALAM